MFTRTVRNNARTTSLATGSKLLSPRSRLGHAGLISTTHRASTSRSFQLGRRQRYLLHPLSRPYKKNHKATTESKNNHLVRTLYWSHDTAENAPCSTDAEAGQRPPHPPPDHQNRSGMPAAPTAAAPTPLRCPTEPLDRAGRRASAAQSGGSPDHLPRQPSTPPGSAQNRRPAETDSSSWPRRKPSSSTANIPTAPPDIHSAHLIKAAEPTRFTAFIRVHYAFFGRLATKDAVQRPPVGRNHAFNGVILPGSRLAARLAASSAPHDVTTVTGFDQMGLTRARCRPWCTRADTVTALRHPASLRGRLGRQHRLDHHRQLGTAILVPGTGKSRPRSTRKRSASDASVSGGTPWASTNGEVHHLSPA